MSAPTKKTAHAHGCRQCRVRYTDNCTDPKEDGLCIGCRGGRPWQLLITNAAPRACCLQARLVTKEEKTRYSLAGRSNWHICPTCRRTHPGKPTEKDIRT